MSWPPMSSLSVKKIEPNYRVAWPSCCIIFNTWLISAFSGSVESSCPATHFINGQRDNWRILRLSKLPAKLVEKSSYEQWSRRQYLPDFDVQWLRWKPWSFRFFCIWMAGQSSDGITSRKILNTPLFLWFYSFPLVAASTNPWDRSH